MKHRSTQVFLQLVGRFALRDLGHKIHRRFRPQAALSDSLVPIVPKQAPLRRPHEQSLKLLMIGPSFQPDGAPISQFELASGLAQRQWPILAVSPSPGPLQARYAASGVETAIWPALDADPNLLDRYTSAVKQIATLIDSHDPHLVYVATLDAHVAVAAAAASGRPVLWNIREGEDWRVRLADRSPSIAARALGCFQAAGAVVFVSRATAMAWSRFTPAERARVIYNAPVTTATRRPRMVPASPVFVTAGTICARKNQAEIAAAIAALDAKLGATLRAVGRLDSAYEQRWRHAVEAAPPGRIETVGEIDDVIAELAGATALVHAAVAEAFPRVLFEAAIAGAPIISARVGGVEERLQHGVSALLYDRGDIPALQDCMRRVAEDRKLAAALAAGARAALVESWTYDEMIAAYESELTALAATSARLDHA